MTLHQEIEAIRRELNIPKYIVCNAFNLDDDKEYDRLINGRKPLSVYQMIMFIDLTHRVPDALTDECTRRLPPGL